jgi:ATP-dependent Clp protease ATP-binding subunit ClpC
MFEKFTEGARGVIVLGQEEARLLGHDYVGTEHLLLGLIREGDGVAATALEALGISLEDVRREVEAGINGNGKQLPAHIQIPFTLGAKKALDLSLAESVRLGHDYVGTEHLLLGLIREGDGVAARVLTRRGADLASVREQVGHGR